MCPYGNGGRNVQIKDFEPHIQKKSHLKSFNAIAGPKSNNSFPKFTYISVSAQITLYMFVLVQKIVDGHMEVLSVCSVTSEG